MRKKAQRIILVLLMLAILPCGTASAWFGNKPTAVIVDDETGEPIEGAIALAQWVKYEATLFEGGIPYAAKAEETVSDEEGKIYIKGYWPWHPFACKRHLTVYKPGYALWNSEKKISPLLKLPVKEFSSSKNEVRLVKFEKAAQEWLKLEAGGIQKYPHSFQSRFLGNCLESGWGKYPVTIDTVFESNEGHFVFQESRRRYEKNKKN